MSVIRPWVCVGGVLLAALAAAPPASAAQSSAAPVVPDRLGTMAPLKATGSAGQKKAAALDARQAAAIAKRMTAAYRGAPASAQIYRSSDLASGVVLMVVSAASPGLFSTSRDAVDDGVAKPVHEVVTVGQVQCLVSNAPRAAGTTLKPEDTIVERCQRSAPKLTVMLDLIGAGQVTHDPKAAASLVDQAWSANRP